VKIHEYQAKELLKSYGVPIQDGVVVEDKAAIADAIATVQKEYDAEAVVVKAQVHAGGRGKGGGVKFCPTTDKAIENANNILGMTLITPQTGADGCLVRKILITEAIDIADEYYLAITLDRSKEMDAFILSTEGGVEIEEVAEETPEKIVKEWIDPAYGLQGYQIRNILGGLGFTGDVAKQCAAMLKKLYKCYKESDCSLLEINPLVLTEQGQLIALDAKINFDGNALFRQPAVAEMRDLHEEDPAEVEASEFHLNYIKLDGNVGCMVNGAGLAMGTMDIIKLKGGEPANFLDVGGGANVETVKNGFRIILSDENVKAVLINIFGGIVRCDRVANGILAAVKELDLNVPVVVRLEGTNSTEAKEILANSGVDVVPADSLDDAATKVVALAQA
jgi:succinyl-CoA synthetase beta subunit